MGFSLNLFPEYRKWHFRESRCQNFPEENDLGLPRRLELLAHMRDIFFRHSFLLQILIKALYIISIYNYLIDKSKSLTYLKAFAKLMPDNANQNHHSKLQGLKCFKINVFTDLHLLYAVYFICSM